MKMNHKMQLGVRFFYYVRRVGPKGLGQRIMRRRHPEPVSYADWLLRKERALPDQAHRETALRAMAASGLTVTVCPPGSRIEDPASVPETGLVLLASEAVCLKEYALWAIASAAKAHPDWDVILTDYEQGSEPVFMPEWNPDLYRASGYSGSVVIVRAAVLRQWMSAHPDSREWAGLLMDLDLEGAVIGHIPMPLYTCDQTESLIRARRAAHAQAVRAHAEAMGWRTGPGKVPGTLHVVPPVNSKDTLTVIIPNRDHLEDLRRCLDGLKAQTLSPEEILIVENGSTDPALFDYYEALTAADQRVRILKWNQPFNYAAVNNYAAGEARGTHYLFLNNDVTLTDPGSLETMLGFCARGDVGAVGARLCYPDGRIQHAGVIIGYGGIAGHAFLDCSGEDPGYMNRSLCDQDMSAVTAACMMVSAGHFHAVGGFDEAYAIAFNDIDFCLRLTEAFPGLHHVMTPFAAGIHAESVSRGAEDTLAKMARYNREVDRFRKRWHPVLEAGDPAYSPNLSLVRWDFSLMGPYEGDARV